MTGKRLGANGDVGRSNADRIERIRGFQARARFETWFEEARRKCPVTGQWVCQCEVRQGKERRGM